MHEGNFSNYLSRSNWPAPRADPRRRFFLGETTEDGATAALSLLLHTALRKLVRTETQPDFQRERNAETSAGLHSTTLKFIGHVLYML